MVYGDDCFTDVEGEMSVVKRALAGAILFLGLTTHQANAATVVTFDDLAGNGTVADGYGGVNWGGGWFYYDVEQPPYTASSPFTRVYHQGSNSLSFIDDVVFVGAVFSGYGPNDGTNFSGISFELLLNGVTVATSASLGASSIPTFLASGYSGLVDQVRVLGGLDSADTRNFGYFVMDDVTYISAVPVPASLPLLLSGLGVVGLIGLRRKQKSNRSESVRRDHT